nr:O-antigen ligase [Aurantimonas marianensis]
MIVFAGIYLLRSGRTTIGLTLTALALLFLFKTGSKTSLALAPAVVLLALLGPRLVGRGRTALALLAAVAGLLALTVGAVIVPIFGDLLHGLIPGTTFTGRTDLWKFALDLAAPLPWTGHGYESFWGSAGVEYSEKPFELSWDMRGAANAHNSYLDVVLELGWPAVAIVLLVMLVFPLIDYARCRPDPENQRLADFFVMVLGFMLLNAALESFFFDREKQAWLLAWIAVVGLRFTSRMTAEP